MPELIFRGHEVRRLVEHAMSQERHYPTLSQLCELQGIGPKDNRSPEKATNEHMRKTPPGLHLVKDQGIYLMSNGSDPRPASESGLIAYAEGYGPGADRNEVRAAAGDDDFVEFLPVGWFRNVCDGDRVILGFTEKRIELLSPKRQAN